MSKKSAERDKAKKSARVPSLSQVYTSSQFPTLFRDTDPDVFGPHGSGSVGQGYGSGSRPFPFLTKVLSGLK